MITVEDLKRSEVVALYLKKADDYLRGIGYTEHGERHACITAERAIYILDRLGYEERISRLAGLAGYLHDVGNVIGRDYHGQSGALIARDILAGFGLPLEDILDVMCAIGNHEEEHGDPTSIISASVIIADKSDVHRSRVRTTRFLDFDIHDRVNYAAEESAIKVSKSNREIILDLVINNEISNVMEYFEIFLSRMMISRRAARVLGCDFSLYINSVKMV